MYIRTGNVTQRYVAHMRPYVPGWLRNRKTFKWINFHTFNLFDLSVLFLWPAWPFIRPGGVVISCAHCFVQREPSFHLVQRLAHSVYWYTTADVKDYWRQ